MLVLKCKKCGNVLAFNLRAGGNSSQALKCPFCGHEDYLDSWLGKSRHRKAVIAGEVVSEIKSLIADAVGRMDLNERFDAISDKYSLSTMTLLRLANIIASVEKDDRGAASRPNLHRYSKIEEKSIAADALLEIVMGQLAVKDSPSNKDSSMPSDTHSHDSVAALQDNYSELEKKYALLKTDFDTLRRENERLKKEVEEYKKFWD